MVKTKCKMLFTMVLVLLLVTFLAACTAVIQPPLDRFPINVTSEANRSLDFSFPQHSTQYRDRLFNRSWDAMDNLLLHLDSETSAVTGYNMSADIYINTFDALPNERSAFKLTLRANLYTYPYYQRNANGDVEMGADGRPIVIPAALARHNELIKRNDVIIEWRDLVNNQLMLGFYFEGIKANSADPGNNLYLDLLGDRRMFRDFGDTVLYQQLIRLITQINLGTVLGRGGDGEESARDQLEFLIGLGVTTNYNEVKNDDITSVLFHSLPLGLAAPDINTLIRSIFEPFGDKLDPLSQKYLGFLFSSLGNIHILGDYDSIEALGGDVRFFMTEPSQQIVSGGDLETTYCENFLNHRPGQTECEHCMREIMTGLDVSLEGFNRTLKTRRGETPVIENVRFTTDMSFHYGLRVSQDIVIANKHTFTPFVMGGYEFRGELFIPMLNLRADGLVRTALNNHTNATNRIFAEFYDRARPDIVLIGLYYYNELTYINITELQNLYGGIRFEDINLPRAYRGGLDLAELLGLLSEFIDHWIVSLVDGILYGDEAMEGSNRLTELIMENVESTMIDPDVPESRNTIRIRLDMDLLRNILTETSATNTTYTNAQMIQIVNELLGIDMQTIAALLGMNIEQLMEDMYFDITYDVDEYSISFQVFQAVDCARCATLCNDCFNGRRCRREVRCTPCGHIRGGALMLQLDLWPTHIGVEVQMAFVLDGYLPLLPIMTYSGSMQGEIVFARTEDVDLSQLAGAFIGDISGLNTQYILPEAAKIFVEIHYDQYIRDQILENGRWTRAGRSAFIIEIHVIDISNVWHHIISIAANDVAFDTSRPVEELGYVWVDLVFAQNVPRVKVREDVFINSLAIYMGEDLTDEDSITIGLTTLVQAMMQDSWLAFEPEVIRVTTSNQIFKDLFQVSELIATFEVQIGFKQRVKGIDAIESRFAMYTVGHLRDIAGPSPYEIELHKSIPVFFDFGDRLVRSEFLIVHCAESIRVTGATVYFAALDGLFMGVTRTYRVLVTGGTDRAVSQVNALVQKHYTWEPLMGEFPDHVLATYGAGNLTGEYRGDGVVFNFFAWFDRETGYYIVPHEVEDDEPYYNILFRAASTPYYVVDLGTHRNLNQAYEMLIYCADCRALCIDCKALCDDCNAGRACQLNPRCIPCQRDCTPCTKHHGDNDIKIVPRVITDVNHNEYTYLINENFELTYVLRTNEAHILYVPNWQWDSELLKWVPFGGEHWVSLSHYNVARRLLPDGAEIGLVSDNAFLSALWSDIDWVDATFRNKNFDAVCWDNMTLEGGLFIVEVIIGYGMMATYRELVTARVLNRTVLTDNYILSSVNNGAGLERVLTPVAFSIDIDPYVYVLFRAYYENDLSLDPWNTQELYDRFTEWYFRHYLIDIHFTEIYGNENDTDPEIGRQFLWNFELNVPQSMFRETQINNRHSAVTSTYVITNFHGQWIALELRVQPRQLANYTLVDDGIGTTVTKLGLSGERYGEYTIDALRENTFVIPTNPTLHFVQTGAGGQQLTLNFTNFDPFDPQGSSIFAGLPAGLTMPQGANITDRRNPPAQNFSDAVVRWSHKSAKNVTLTGNIGFPFHDGTINLGASDIPLFSDYFVLSGTATVNFEGTISTVTSGDVILRGSIIVSIVVGSAITVFAIDENSNINTGFVDLRSHIDPLGAWFANPRVDSLGNPVLDLQGNQILDDWFVNPLITIRVQVPDKVVERINTGTGHGSVNVPSYGGTIPNPHNIRLAGNAAGIWAVNPYIESTWVLPNSIQVLFNTATADVFDTMTYAITWETTWFVNSVDTGITNPFIINQNGTFRINTDAFNMLGTRQYGMLQVIVGNRENPAMSLVLDILLVKESGIVEAYNAYESMANLINNIVVAGTDINRPLPFRMDSLGLGEVWEGGRYYRYEVDTFNRFALPQFVTIKFDDGSLRTFAVTWDKVWSRFDDDFYRPANQILLRANIGGSLNAPIFLMVAVADRLTPYVAGIEFLSQSGTLLTDLFHLNINVQAANNHVNISGVDFDFNSGTVRVLDRLGNYHYMNPYDFFVFLFQNLRVTLSPQVLTNYYNITASGYMFDPAHPHYLTAFDNVVNITDAVNSAIWDIVRTFDAQRVLAANGGQDFTVFMGQGFGGEFTNFTINLRAGLLQAESANHAENNLFPFDIATGAHNYEDGDGFVFSRDMDVSPLTHAQVQYRYATITVNYAGGVQHVWESPMWWYVALTQDLRDRGLIGAGQFSHDFAASDFAEGDRIRIITKEQMLRGTYIWVTTMMPDGTRIYRKLNIVGVNLEHGFYISERDESAFARANGTIDTTVGEVNFRGLNSTITVRNVYEMYVLLNALFAEAELSERNTFSALTAAHLPRYIRLHTNATGGLGGAELTVENWVMQISASDLLSINWQTNWVASPRLLATAQVFGETISLYLIVLPNVVDNVWHSTGDEAADFRTVVVPQLVNSVLTNVLTVYIAPYTHTSYNGTFTFPTQIGIRFAGQSGFYINPNVTYLLNAGTFAVPLLGLAPNIPYTHAGIVWNNEFGNSSVLIAIELADGQLVHINFVFVVQELEFFVVDGYTATVGTATDRNTYNADPYDQTSGRNSRFIPTGVTAFFTVSAGDQTFSFGGGFNSANGLIALAGGQSFNFGTLETQISDDSWQGFYELSYNSHQRWLNPLSLDFIGEIYFAVHSNISSQAHLAQTLNLMLFVEDRQLTEWSFNTPALSTIIDYLGMNVDNPRAWHHFNDPFAGRASDLPEQVSGLFESVASPTYPVIWTFTTSQITAAGTVNLSPNFLLVTGSVVDEDFGQSVTLRVYVDRWDFNAIRRRVPASSPPQWNIMIGESLRFIFQRDTGMCSEEEFQIVFNIQRFNINSAGALMSVAAPVIETRQFATHLDFDDATRGHYFIEFSQVAIEQARNPASNNTGRGAYFLVNRDGRRLMSPNQTATYQFEFISIETFDLGYGVFGNNINNGRGNVIYVANPINIQFENETFRVPVWGRRHEETALSLLGLASINWRSQHLTNTNPDNAGFISPFLKGRTLIHTIEMVIEYEYFRHVQMFDIMIVFLDISPHLSPLAVQQDHLHGLRPLHTYLSTTYADLGISNPYREAYTATTTSFAAGQQLAAGGTRPLWQVLNIGTARLNMASFTYNATFVEWENTENSHLVYSRTVQINGTMTYTTDMIRAARL
jgi:hypothetical protein